MPFPQKPRKAISEEAALARLAQQCSAAEHCSGDIRATCQKWGLGPDAAERIVATLVRERFVDDSRFAPLFVKDKARFEGWGPAKIRMKMQAKGLDDSVIDDALAALDKEEWQAILLKALKSKLRTARSPQGDEPDLAYGTKLYASLVRFALQRGFAYSDVAKAIERLGGGGNDEN